MVQEAFLLFIHVLYLIPTLLLFSLLSLRDIVLDKRDLSTFYDLFVSNIILLLFYILHY